MCKFNQEIHVCGHINYVLHSACPSYIHASPTTKKPTCSLIPSPTCFLPSSFIYRTTNLRDTSCSEPHCFYTIESDPFHFEASGPSTATLFGPARSPPLPSFTTPKRLRPSGPSLYDELLAVDPTLSFVESIQLEAQHVHSPEPTRRSRPQLRLSRGNASGDTPRGVYHKYSRLSRIPGERRHTRVGCEGSPKEGRAEGLYETPTKNGKRKRMGGGGGCAKMRRVAMSKADEEALTCGIKALSVKGQVDFAVV